jgi:hypothetical protein
MSRNDPERFHDNDNPLHTWVRRDSIGGSTLHDEDDLFATPLTLERDILRRPIRARSADGSLYDIHESFGRYSLKRVSSSSSYWDVSGGGSGGGGGGGLDDGFNEALYEAFFPFAFVFSFVLTPIAVVGFLIHVYYPPMLPFIVTALLICSGCGMATMSYLLGHHLGRTQSTDDDYAGGSRWTRALFRIEAFSVWLAAVVSMMLAVALVIVIFRWVSKLGGGVHEGVLRFFDIEPVRMNVYEGATNTSSWGSGLDYRLTPVGKHALTEAWNEWIRRTSIASFGVGVIAGEVLYEKGYRVAQGGEHTCRLCKKPPSSWFKA